MFRYDYILIYTTLYIYTIYRYIKYKIYKDKKWEIVWKPLNMSWLLSKTPTFTHYMKYHRVGGRTSHDMTCVSGAYKDVNTAHVNVGAPFTRHHDMRVHTSRCETALDAVQLVKATTGHQLSTKYGTNYSRVQTGIRSGTGVVLEWEWYWSRSGSTVHTSTSAYWSCSGAVPEPFGNGHSDTFFPRC